MKQPADGILIDSSVNELSGMVGFRLASWYGGLVQSLTKRNLIVWGRLLAVNSPPGFSDTSDRLWVELH